MSALIKLTPMDTLGNGTTVTIVNGGRGVITNSKLAKDQHGKPIMVHEVKRTHDMRGREVDEKPKFINYSFILYRVEDIKF